MSEEMLVQYCSPTLAGLKVANLFTYKYETKENLRKFVAYYNRLLNPRGVYFKILRSRNGKAQVYVYRKAKLERILACCNARAFLKKFGYQKFDINYCLDRLKEHLEKSDFPHEIGIFLGYPLLDVEAFIKNKGQHHKCIGCWKVYGDETEARKTFGRFDKCTRIYLEKHSQGTAITRLAVAV